MKLDFGSLRAIAMHPLRDKPGYLSLLSSAAFSAAVATALPARADDPAYGVRTQLHVQAAASYVDTEVQDSGLVQAAGPVTYSLTASAAGGGASARATATATPFYGYLNLSGSGSASQLDWRRT